MDLAPAALRGSYPPLVTPFRDGAVDLDGYRRLVARAINSGSHGLVVNGTTAEPSLLSLSERKATLETALETSSGRLPVVAATGTENLAGTLELTRHAEQAGANAVLVVTPYYVRPGQDGLVHYFRAVCDSTDLPVLLYHIPGRAAVGVEPTTLERISETAANFVGMKHASPDLALVTDALRALGPDFRIFVGLEELSFPMLALGACGMVNAVANLVPGPVSQLYDAVAAGKLEEAHRTHLELWELNRAIFFETNPIPLKYMMLRCGILDTNEERLPMTPASATTRARCDEVLQRAGLISPPG